MAKNNRFVSPGVYTKEVDVSGFSIPKRLLRISKIKELFGVNPINPLYINVQSGISSYTPVKIDNYQDFEDMFGGSTNDLKKNI